MKQTIILTICGFYFLVAMDSIAQQRIEGTSDFKYIYIEPTTIPTIAWESLAITPTKLPPNDKP